jgi:hypothetical protein
MPASMPPPTFRGTANTITIPNGSELWRVHGSKYAGDAFRPVNPDPTRNTDQNFGGGRFDSTSYDPYPYLYAATKPTTALAETFLRDLDFRSAGDRILPRRAVAGMKLSAIRVQVELSLVSLISATDLAAVYQDHWLVDADGAAHYAQTRRWAHWLRRHSPDTHGLAWQSKRDRPFPAFILFGDRCPPGALSLIPTSSIDLDDANGATQLNALLRPYLVKIISPRRTTP